MRKILLGSFILGTVLFLAACDNQLPYYHEVEAYDVISLVEEVADEAIYDAKTVDSLVKDEADYNPLASALYSFFEDAVHAPAPEDFYGYFMPYSTHAIFVDLDGNGTQGVLASRWVQNQRSRHSFEQYLLWFCGGELRKESPMFFRFSVTPSGRLVMMDEIGACNIFVDLWALLDFVDGELAFIEGVSIRTSWALGWMLEDYDDPDYLHIFGIYYNLITYTNGNPWESHSRSWEETPITYEEFQEIMVRHGLHDAISHVWEFPDETQTILSGGN